jgi:hypothetical protein
LKIISETNFETGGKNKKNASDRILTELGRTHRFPERAGPLDETEREGISNFKLMSGTHWSAHLTNRTGTRP